jgi:hypothetical protein
MIRFTCPGCDATYTVEDAKGGKTGKCPKCQARFTIPLPAGGAAPPPSSAVDPNAPVEIAPCPKCQARLSVTVADLGVDVECPYCKQVYKAVRAGGSAGRKALVEEDEDRPNRRRRDEAEDEARPSRRRRDEEEEEEERPRRRRRDEEEEEAEARPSRRRRDDEEEEDEERPRRRREEDEVEEEPRKRKRKKRRVSRDSEEAEKAASTSTNLGVAGLILAICCALAGLICGILAVTNGMKAKNLSDGELGQGGIIMGSIAIVLSIINIIVGIILRVNNVLG